MKGDMEERRDGIEGRKLM